MKCERCGEVNPAEIHTCTPKQGPVAWGLQQQFEGRIGTTPVAFKRHDEFGFVVPLYTAPPKQEEGCAECGKKSSEGWALYCVKCLEAVQEPIGWIYEDDEGRMMFSQMPHPDPLWEPVYRAKRTWQGLTDEEVFAALVAVDGNTQRLAPGFIAFYRAIEARLKAKNG